MKVNLLQFLSDDAGPSTMRVVTTVWVLVVLTVWAWANVRLPAGSDMKDLPEFVALTTLGVIAGKVGQKLVEKKGQDGQSPPGQAG